MIGLAGVGTQHYLASLASLTSMVCYGPGVTTKLKPFYLRVVRRADGPGEGPRQWVGDHGQAGLGHLTSTRWWWQS